METKFYMQMQCNSVRYQEFATVKKDYNSKKIIFHKNTFVLKSGIHSLQLLNLKEFSSLTSCTSFKNLVTGMNTYMSNAW